MTYIKKILKKLYFVHKIYSLINKSNLRIISRSELSENFLPNNFDEKFFNYKNILGIPKSKKPISNTIPSVAGWVPYIKNKTNIVLYNFFSINYSLRKILFVRLSIINKNKVSFQDSFWFDVNAISEINLTTIAKDIEGKSVALEFFHPDIKVNHGGQDGHLRFWGKYYDSSNNFLSTVHSMPLPKNAYFLNKNIFSRAYFFSTDFSNKVFYEIYSLGFSQKITDDKDKKYLSGFNVAFDSGRNPVAVWHLAPFIQSEYKKISKNTKKMIQSFWVPSIKNIDPLVVIDNRELGISGEQNARFLIIAKNKILFEKKINFTENVFKIKVSELYKEKIEGEYIFLCEFYYNRFGYINVHYSTQTNINDQVHAHMSSWQIENNQILPKRIKSRGSARKFFHITKNIEKYSHYLLIHLHHIEDKDDAKFKVRALSDSGFEFVKNYIVNVNEPIYVINIEKDFFDFYSNLNKVGVIQFESNYDNYEGSMLFYDKKTTNVAVDHLTGG